MNTYWSAPSERFSEGLYRSSWIIGPHAPTGGGGVQPLVGGQEEPIPLCRKGSTSPLGVPALGGRGSQRESRTTGTIAHAGQPHVNAKFGTP